MKEEKKIPLRDRITIVWDELRAEASRDFRAWQDERDRLAEEQRATIVEMEAAVAAHAETLAGQHELATAQARVAQYGLKVSVNGMNVLFSLNGCQGVPVRAELVFRTINLGDIPERYYAACKAAHEHQIKRLLIIWMKSQPQRVKDAIKAELLRRDHNLATLDDELLTSLRTRIGAWKW